MELILTVRRKWNPELTEDHFKDDEGILPEWPLGSGQTLDINDPAQVAAFTQWQLDEGEIEYDELLEPGSPDELTWTVEHVVEQQIMEPQNTGENPFLPDAKQDAGAKEEASGADADPLTDAPTTEEDATASTSATGSADNEVGDQGAREWKPSLSDEAQREENNRYGRPDYM